MALNSDTGLSSTVNPDSNGVSVERRSSKGEGSFVLSVLKATKLIECFVSTESVISRGHAKYTLQELVAISGYPVSTVHRLLATLHRAGWVTKHGNSYALSLRIAEIASHILADIDLREEARPLMQELSRASGDTTYLVTREDDHAVCIERVSGDRTVRVMAWDVGSTLPLYSGAAPLALLAFEGPAEIDRFLSSNTLVHPNGRPTNRSIVLGRLQLVRQHGWVFSQDETFEGIASIGAPVFGPNGVPAAALSIGGLAAGFKSPRREERAALLLSTADHLSRLIGYTGPKPVQ